MRTRRWASLKTIFLFLILSVLQPVTVMAEEGAAGQESLIYEQLRSEIQKDHWAELMPGIRKTFIPVVIIFVVAFILTILCKKGGRIFWGFCTLALLFITANVFVQLRKKTADISQREMVNKTIDWFMEGRYLDAQSSSNYLMQTELRNDALLDQEDFVSMMECNVMSDVALVNEELVLSEHFHRSIESAEEMFETALDYYEDGKYELAEAYWRVMLVQEVYRGYPTSDFSYTREELLNNLSLAQLQIGKNEEALENMCSIFTEGEAEIRYVLNLLVAAAANGISAQDILEETDAGEVMKVWAEGYDPTNPGVSLKTKTAIAFNMAWMDMELKEEDVEKAVGIESLIYPQSYDRYLEAYEFTDKEQLLEHLDQLLQVLNEDEEKMFEEADPDVTELRTYLQELRNGGIPKYADTAS